MKYADETVLVANIAAHSDFVNYQTEVVKMSEMCKQLDLILNPTKTYEHRYEENRWGFPRDSHVNLDGCHC